MPLFDIPIKAVLRLGSERCVGQLWDISRSGACVRFHHALPPDGEGPARLRIHAPYSEEVIETPVRVAWSNALGPHHYTGLEMVEPVDFSITFLARLMRGPGR